MRRQRELTPDDLRTGQPPPIDLSPSGLLNREPEEIIPVDKPMSMDYAAALAFSEEEVTIRLERTADKNPAPFHTFWVQGRAQVIPVGKSVKVKRKYLEVILRSQPFDVETDVGDATMKYPHNRIVRYQSKRYPVSIIHDPNPRGAEWAERVVLES